MRLTPAAVRQSLAASDMEEYLAEEWPAAIRWAAKVEKEGVEWIIPIPDVLRTVLVDYIRARALVGHALLSPARWDAAKPLSKETAYSWIRQAEDRAKVPLQHRGGWHADGRTVRAVMELEA
jgi:hypothetical protein